MNLGFVAILSSGLLLSVLGEECATHGCTDAMRMDKFCDPSCMNSVCNFDRPSITTSLDKSGCFSSCLENGCTEAMLTNNSCDTQCNNLSCGWDWGKCTNCGLCHSAPHNCIYPTCKDNSCSYFNDSCATEEEFLAYTNQLKNNNYGYPTYLYQTCYKSGSLCTTEKLSNSICDQECNTEACAYDLGKCIKSCSSSCNYCYVKDNSDKCLTCSDPTKYLYASRCVKNCLSFHTVVTSSFNSLWDNQNVSVKLCVPIKDLTTETNPETVYVTSNRNLDSVNSNGSFDNPYTHISLALAEVHSKYTTIYLLNVNDGVHYLDDFNTNIHQYTTDYLKETKEFGMYGVDPTKIELKPYKCTELIKTSCYDTTIPIIQRGDYSYLPIKIGSGAELVISDAIISGKKSIASKGCTNPYKDDSTFCTYCPNFELDHDGKLFTDKSITETTLYDYAVDSDCTNQKDTKLLYVQGSGVLNFINVKFSDWRAQFSSLIYIEGSASIPQLILENVDFYNVMATRENEESAIIHMNSNNCTSSYKCGKISYNGGLVTLLNNGYELSTTLFFTGFMHASRLEELTLQNVTFNYNISYKGAEYKGTLTNYGFIYINNFKMITVKNCTFKYNIVSKAIFNLVMDTNYDQTINEMNTQHEDYEITHISFESNTFENNYGPLVLLASEKEHPNIKFNTNSFINNTVMDFEKYMIDLGIEKWNDDWYLGSRQVNFITTTIKNCYAIAGMIYLKNVANVEFSALKVSDSLEKPATTPKYNYFDELVYSKFVSYQPSYIYSETPKSITSSELEHSKHFLNLVSITGLTINSLELLNSYSSQGCTNIYIDGISEKLQVESATIKDNTCNCSKGIGITVTKAKGNMIISALEASNNINKDPDGMGVLRISADSDSGIASDLKLHDSNFSSIISGGECGVYLQVHTGTLKNLKFLNNVLSKMNSAVLYVDVSKFIENSTYYVTISNVTFKSNTNLVGGGAALYIDKSQENIGKNKLIIENCYFESNTSETDAAAISISSMVKLKDSSITNCSFLKNESKIKGNVKLYQREGTLTFNNCSFEQNISIYGIALYISNVQDEIQLNNVTFTSNLSIDSTLGTLIQLIASDNLLTVVTNNCKFERNSGTAVKLESNKWKDTGSSFNSNSAYQGSVLDAMTGSEATLTGTTISSNTSKISGGVAVLSGESSLSLNNCNVTGNKSEKSGGVIFMEQRSKVYTNYSTFTNNTAQEIGSVISSIGCNKDASYIKNSVLSENISIKGGTLILISSNINITDSEFHYNSMSKSPNIVTGIIATLSALKIYGTTFKDQYGVRGGSLYLTSGTTAEIEDCTFQDGGATEQGGAIYYLSSNVNINNSRFKNLTAKSAAVILLNSVSELSITNSQFENCKSTELGSVIKAFESKLNITNSTFEDFIGPGITGISLTHMNISYSDFIKGAGEYGGAIYCEKCEDVTLLNNNFLNNSATLGGAVYFITSKDKLIGTPYQILNCNFTSNTAETYGGGLYSENLNFTISNSHFISNSAEDDGGGINMQCPDVQDSECNFYLMNNVFKENKAGINGGAISWLDFKPENSSNTFYNNQAPYGADFGSFATGLAILDENLEVVSVFRSRNLQNSVPILGSLDEMPPGQAYTQSLLIGLVDEYHKIVTTDTKSFGELSMHSDNGSMSGILKIQIDNGIFNFSSFTIYGRPGSSLNISVNSDGVQEVSKYSGLNTYPDIGITVNLRKCILGESHGSKECVLCEDGQYSIDTNDQICKSCPSEANCDKGYKIFPKAGYWRKDMYTDTFYDCPNPDACLGSSNYTGDSYSGECATGYMGNLCQSCQDGYSRTSKDQCGKCPDAASNAMKLTGILIGVILVCAVMVKTTMDSAYKQKSLQSIYIKIFFNYLQLVMLTASFELDWPEYVLEVFSVQENAGTATDQIFSVDCFISNKGGTGYSSAEVYYFKLMIMLALPILIFIISVLVWSSISIYKKTLKYLKSEFLATIVILLFLVHPNIVKSMFSAYSCMEIEGENWLLENLQIKCWDSQHYFYAIYVALPGIIVWGLGIPTVCLFYLFKSRRRLKDISIRLKFGFLFNGYCKTRFYWEFVILYRKIIIIFCSVFLSSFSVPVQGLTVMIVLIISLHLQNISNPYSNPTLNQMEIRSILVASITIYSGLFYLTGDLSEMAKLTFFVIIVVSNAYFLYYWLLKMLEISLGVFIMKIPLLRKKFSKTLADGYDDDIFVVSPKNKNVIKKNGEILFTFCYNRFKYIKNQDKNKELLYIQTLETKDLYIEILRSKILPQYNLKYQSDSLKATNLENITEESPSDYENQSSLRQVEKRIDVSNLDS